MTLTQMHYGRQWTGHEIEDSCPCPKAACGLIEIDPEIECDQHNPSNPILARTMRQAHWAEHCPALDNKCPRC